MEDTRRMLWLSFLVTLATIVLVHPMEFAQTMDCGMEMEQHVK